MKNALPTDGNFKPFDSVPSSPVGTPLAVTYDATVSGSTTVTFNAATSYIEVTALLKGIFMKWDGTATSSSFDEFIAPESTRGYSTAGHATAQFIEEAASAHLVVIEKA